MLQTIRLVYFVEVETKDGKYGIGETAIDVVLLIKDNTIQKVVFRKHQSVESIAEEFLREIKEHINALERNKQYIIKSGKPLTIEKFGKTYVIDTKEIDNLLSFWEEIKNNIFSHMSGNNSVSNIESVAQNERYILSTLHYHITDSIGDILKIINKGIDVNIIRPESESAEIVIKAKLRGDSSVRHEVEIRPQEDTAKEYWYNLAKEPFDYPGFITDYYADKDFSFTTLFTFEIYSYDTNKQKKHMEGRLKLSLYKENGKEYFVVGNSSRIFGMFNTFEGATDFIRARIGNNTKIPKLEGIFADIKRHLDTGRVVYRYCASIIKNYEHNKLQNISVVDIDTFEPEEVSSIDDVYKHYERDLIARIIDRLYLKPEGRKGGYALQPEKEKGENTLQSEKREGEDTLHEIIEETIEKIKSKDINQQIARKEGRQR